MAWLLSLLLLLASAAVAAPAQAQAHGRPDGDVAAGLGAAAMLEHSTEPEAHASRELLAAAKGVLLKLSPEALDIPRDGACLADILYHCKHLLVGTQGLAHTRQGLADFGSVPVWGYGYGWLGWASSPRQE